uniref:glucuronosyltransferase n=2 Tax=Meloidogyne incognita group TaxID=654580 RepID=A0A915LCD4_MELJA
MLVYTDTEVLKIESVKFKIIPVPINDVNNIVKYRNSVRYSTIGIYKDELYSVSTEIITNENGILDWLQQNHYDIGIAEFNVMAGSFAVFEALGIEETFDVSCSVFVPQYLQFSEIKDLDYQFPEYSSAKPGDWVNGEWQKDGEENEREHERINEWAHNTFIENSQKSYNTLFNNYGISKNIKKPSPFDVLFKKIKYHFINQHPLIKFNDFPEHNKFVYIGGINVEVDKLLTEGKQMPDCVILVTFGTAGYQTYPFGKMIKSMYAGVPLICIPKSGDQKYNASIVESKGVGIYVDYEDLKDSTESLGAALYQILNIDDEGNFNFNSKYSLAAEKMRNNILRNYDPETKKTMKDKFLGKFDGTN